MSDTCREKLIGKREVYRRSDGRQELHIKLTLEKKILPAAPAGIRTRNLLIKSLVLFTNKLC